MVGGTGKDGVHMAELVRVGLEGPQLSSFVGQLVVDDMCSRVAGTGADQGPGRAGQGGVVGQGNVGREQVGGMAKGVLGSDG